VNRAIVEDSPVRALTTTLQEARSLGAMALFGEKYGDVVRMVEVGDGGWSRELCGGTHVRSTGVIGVFKITTETSSAANVRRIEAITGEAAIEQLRAHDRALSEAARVLRTSPLQVAEIAAERERARRELEKRTAAEAPVDERVDPDRVTELDGVRVLVDTTRLSNPKQLPDLADRFKNQLGDPAVVVLGAPGEGRVSLLVAATPGAVQRGVNAGSVVKVAAEVVGGGGGGRDNMAQAGGRDPEKLPEALDAARAAIRAALNA
jgi:alanyl-tRNA synthetase